MSHIIGIDPTRPPPPPPRYVAVDWNEWRYELVLWEEYRAIEERERALGTCEVPPHAKALRRRGGGRRERVGKANVDPALATARRILVEQRVVTAAASLLMTPMQLSEAIEDLQRRLDAKESIGMEPTMKEDER